MGVGLLLCLCGATMFLMNLLRRGKYNVSAPKAGMLTILIGMVGVLGTYILYFIENGVWAGKSFFGAVLFFPILLAPVAWLSKMKLVHLLDYATPSGMGMLVIYKYNCYISNCCRGAIMWYTEEGVPVPFPSQIVEMICALIITGVLLIIERKGKAAGLIYPICLLIYGPIRFILNLFRWEQTSFLMGLPAGNFWSVVAVIVGLVWLIVVNKYLKKTRSI